MKLKILLICTILLSLGISFLSFYSFKSYSLLTLLFAEITELNSSVESSNGRIDDLELFLADINSRVGDIALEQSSFEKSMYDYSQLTNDRLDDLGYRTVSKNQFESLLISYYSPLEDAINAVASQKGTAGPADRSEEVNDPADPLESTRNTALSLLEKNPNNLNALKTLGRLSYEEGDEFSAKQYLAKVIELEPDDRDSYMILSRISFHEGEYRDSALYFQRLISLEETAQSRTGLGRCLFLLGDYESAYVELMAALALDENYLPALELVSDTCIPLMKDREAEYYLSKLIGLDKSFANYYRLGEFYGKKGRSYDSLIAFEEALKLNPLKTLDQQTEQRDLLRAMSEIAYELQSDSQLEKYYYDSELLGGDERILLLRLRRLKELGDSGKILKSIELFENNYPESPYREEVSIMKKWAKGV